MKNRKLRLLVCALAVLLLAAVAAALLQGGQRGGAASYPQGGRRPQSRVENGMSAPPGSSSSSSSERSVGAGPGTVSSSMPTDPVLEECLPKGPYTPVAEESMAELAGPSWMYSFLPSHLTEPIYQYRFFAQTETTGQISISLGFYGTDHGIFYYGTYALQPGGTITASLTESRMEEESGPAPAVEITLKAEWPASGFSCAVLTLESYSGAGAKAFGDGFEAIKGLQLPFAKNE